MIKKMKKYILTAMFLISSLSFAAVETGSKAPIFEITDHNGKKVSLSDYQDKVVVLEWYNQDCPFVRKHYDPKNMQGLQAEYGQKDVVWLKIISSAPGKQGYLDEAQVAPQLAKEGSKVMTLLRDVSGDVGRAYDAKTTPHMYIINKGTLVYQGAIDSIPSANTDDIAKADNYVSMALDQVMAGEPVKIAKTKAYGCSVKF
jgi:peroxiredoxin